MQWPDRSFVSSKELREIKAFSQGEEEGRVRRRKTVFIGENDEQVVGQREVTHTHTSYNSQRSTAMTTE